MRASRKAEAQGCEEDGIENGEADEIKGLGNYAMNGKTELKHVLEIP